ncbi:diphthine methyl ester synthase [Nematocida major]|uniref:diphthine methyl ester synthase n=1 Tax=Nematocida major TaxID=1912982 RepID=UPI0020074EB4|nr:diphthine methyl ester synthase [Nematocida major]KAH9386511.1 diphthine methyl ester synthase [Nematocida major]
MLSLVGLGLEPGDISLKGARLAREADVVYLEKYTSIVLDETEIEAVLGREVKHAYREEIEGAGGSEPFIIEEASSKNVVLLVVGTPLFATTHTELLIRAQELGIPVRVLHNASIQSAFGCCGFNSYGFGRTVSIPFFIENWRPYDFVRKIMENFSSGLHTLCLLDIKINEPTLETLLGKEDRRYTRFMTIPEAVSQIQEAAQHCGVTQLAGAKAVAIERLGLPSEEFTYGTLEDLQKREYGPPLHSIIIPSAHGNEMERECVERFFQARGTAEQN